MLEILVDLARGADGEVGSGGPLRVAGDILVAKQHPAVWGKKERERFLITLLDDPDVEAEVDEDGMIVMPYVVRDGKDILTQSAYRVDLSMFAGSPGLDPNIECEVCLPEGADCLIVGDLIHDATERVDDE